MTKDKILEGMVIERNSFEKQALDVIAENEILKSIVKQYELMEKDYEALIELHRANN